MDKSLLTFEESTHTYKYDGQVVDSVTRILKPISQEIYKGINQNVMDKAAARGTEIHFAIELYSEYGVIEIDDEYKPYLDAYIQFKQDFNHKPLKNEYRVYSELYDYCGTFDNLGTINAIETLIDYKNTSVLHDKLVGLQLSAYRQALKEEGIIVNQAGCLQLKPNGKYKFIIYKEKELDEHFEIFKKLLEMKNIIKYYGGKE